MSHEQFSMSGCQIGGTPREFSDAHFRLSDSLASIPPSIEKSRAALVYGQMTEPPGARLRVGLSALTVAEYFRDAEGKDVLLFIDNIFRFTQAGSEVSALLGRMPSAVGYQPTLLTEMGELQERITSTKKGSITSVQAIYVPADDLTDPAPATAFAHLDATTVLSRKLTEIGIYPAVDPLDSTSRILDPLVVGDEPLQQGRNVRGRPVGVTQLFPLPHAPSSQVDLTPDAPNRKASSIRATGTTEPPQGASDEATPWASSVKRVIR